MVERSPSISVQTNSVQTISVQTISVQVLAPSLLRQAMEALLSGRDGIDLSSDEPAVILLAGGDWPSRLEAAMPAFPQGLPAMVLLTEGSEAELLQACGIGIQVFLSPSDGIPALEQAIGAAAARRAFCSPLLLPGLMATVGHRAREGAANWLPPARRSLLSEREMQVATHAVQGCTSAEIGQRLYLSEATVKFHLTQVYRKLGIRRRSQLGTFMNSGPLAVGVDGAEANGAAAGRS